MTQKSNTHRSRSMKFTLKNQTCKSRLLTPECRLSTWKKHSLYMNADNAVCMVGMFTGSYILMRKAVACELGVSVVEVVWAVDLNRAFRMVWGSTSGVGWEEARWPLGRDKEEGRPSFFGPLPVPGLSLSLLKKVKKKKKIFIDLKKKNNYKFLRPKQGQLWI